MLHLVLEDQLFIGRHKREGAHSTVHDHLVVMFEDNGESGYFYALDMRRPQPVADSLFVYGVDAIEGREEARKLQICWSEDGNTAYLLLNDYPHAVFDFVRLIGYNHSKYPPPEFGSMWSHEEITDKLIVEWLK